MIAPPSSQDSLAPGALPDDAAAHTLAAIEITPVACAMHRAIARHGAPIEQRLGLRVMLRDALGHSGFGEAWPLVAAGTESLRETDAAARTARRALLHRTLPLPAVLALLERELPDAPAARAAFDIAAHDLAARRRGVPVAVYLGAPAEAEVAVNAMLGAGDIAETVGLARAACDAGYRALKLKVGAAALSADVARVAAVRAAVGAGVCLRVDANGAWTKEEALDVLGALARYDVSLVEQPVRADALDALAYVHARSPIPVAADESLATAEGRARLLGGALASVAVIKLMVQGGLGPAAALCAAARRCAVRTLVTTTLDGPVATAAALHLAAAQGTKTFAHGLDAAAHVAGAFPKALVPVQGRLAVRQTPGLALERGDLAERP
jgi:o-succinylbenzoate synthase